MEHESHVAFGELLRQARRNAGLTQEALAERAGISTRAVSNLERGINRSPQRDTLEMLSHALGLSSEDRLLWERARSRLALRTFRNATDSAAGDGQPEQSLPTLFTSFIGRDEEIREATAVLRRPDVRLLTVTGTGGIGKTRLAIRVAGEMRTDFRDGVHFVSLAPIAHAGLVPSGIAQVLGVRAGSGQTLLKSLIRFLQTRNILLVLDNFEHVVSGAASIATLLAECPGLTVLVTSRVSLRLTAEHEYQLRSLCEHSAAALFIERSQEARPSFPPCEGQNDTILQICRRLDGLPLAIELAAARSKVLSSQSLLDRLERPLEILTSGPRDLPVRQQTLRAAIGWSYDLLGPDERDVFQRLSVFMGGFTLEAAEAVCERDVLESMTVLVESSLVELHEEINGEPRLRMLETIREFGLELLAQNASRADIRRRHAMFMASLVTAAPPFLIGPDQILWLDRFEADHANIMAALDWCLEWDIETGLRMLAALWSFWWLRTPLTAPRQYFDRFLERADNSIEPATLAAALTGAGIIIEFESDLDLDRAAALYEQALSIWLDLPDPPEGAYWSYLNLGGIARRQGSLREAEAYYLQTLDYAERNNQPVGVTGAFLHLGNLAATRGQRQQAKTYFRDGLAIAREIQDPFLTAAHLGNLGSMFVSDGRFDEARPLLDEALALNRAIKLTRHVSGTLENLASLEFRLGRLAEAEQLFTESLVEARKVNESEITGWAYLGLGRIALKRGDLTEAANLLLQSVPYSRSGGAHPCLASAVEDLATTARLAGDVARAARLLGWAATFRERMGVPQRPLMQPELDLQLQAVRDALAPEEFNLAWETGAGLTLDELCPGLPG